MKRYKKILVPLGLLDHDLGAISWASRIASLANSEEVLFVHSLDIPDVSEETQKRYPWLMAPLDETIIGKMKELVEPHWNGPAAAKVSYEIAKAKGDTIGILQTELKQDSDLIIVGRQAFGAGMGVKLARKASCSVMSVPTDHAKKLERILVPTDFSENSRAALDVAIAIAQSEELTKIDSIHVFNLGSFHHKITLPEEEQIQLATDFAAEMHHDFLKSTDLHGVKVDPHLVCDRSVAMAANKLSRELNVDLIVSSCRGKNAMSSWLLGSNAESLLEHAPVPIIAAKIKGTGKSLLESLLSS